MQDKLIKMNSINFNIKDVISKGAPEDEVRELIKMVQSGSFRDIYTSIVSYKIDYENDSLDFLDSKNKFMSEPPEFVIDGLLSEGAVVVENRDNLQILTNAYSGLGVDNIKEVVENNHNKFKMAQVMYIWVAPLKNSI